VSFQVEPYPDQTFDGKVAFISPTIDQTTRTFVVEVLVDNVKRQLRPGLFAKGVILSRRDDNVLAVPEESVSTLAGVSTVYVIDRGKVRQQPVSIGERQQKLLEVVDGLKGNEVLAASNLSQLATGVSVELKGAPTGTEAPQ
jgi:RND family efflux transporter MFP subunit